VTHLKAGGIDILHANSGLRIRSHNLHPPLREILIEDSSDTHILHRSIAKLINRKTGRIETAQEWLGYASTAHTPAYIDAEDYREKANGVVAGLDI